MNTNSDPSYSTSIPLECFSLEHVSVSDHFEYRCKEVDKVIGVRAWMAKAPPNF